MSASEYHVYLRGPDRTRVMLMDDFTSLSLVPNFNDASKWTLDLPGSSKALNEVGAKYGIIVEHEDEAEPVLSGNIETMVEKGGDSTTLTLSGSDDTAWLARRQVLPCAPSGTTGTVYAGSDYDYESDHGEIVMRAFVQNSAISVNPIEGLALDVFNGLGLPVVEQGRFGTLLAQLQSVATHAGGLGFRIVQAADSTDLLFKVYQPRDRSATVIFSKAFGNLQSYSYQTQIPTCNHVIVAGGGDLASRVFCEMEDIDSIVKWGRITSFVDQRQTTDPTQLAQKASEALTNGGEKNSLSLVPVDTTALRFGRDYRVGDIGRVDIAPGVPVVDVIRQVTLTIKPAEDLVVKPVIGSAQANDPSVPDFFKQRKDLASRLTVLETS